MTYDADRIRGWYADFDEREWQRLEATLLGRIKYAIHRHVLLEAVRTRDARRRCGLRPGPLRESI